MKYTNGRAFFKHLQASSPDHFTNVYLIVAKEPFDRKTSLDALLHYLVGGKEKKMGITSLDAETLSGDALGSELHALSFFSDKRVILIKQVEKLKAQTKNVLEKYLDSTHGQIFLIMIAESLPGTTKIFKKAEKSGVVLSVPAKKKGWEKEQQVADWLHRLAEIRQKHLDAKACAALIQRVGTDQSLLVQEMEKLCCYVGKRSSITNQDVEAICIYVDHETGWRLGDMIFQRKPKQSLEIGTSLLREGIALIAILRQLRKQFETQLSVAFHLEKGKGAHELTAAFPYMKGRILSHNVELAKIFGVEALKAGIVYIDTTEVEAKNSGVNPALLLERLIIRICHATSLAQSTR